jgi:hypothetical protein
MIAGGDKVIVWQRQPIQMICEDCYKTEGLPVLDDNIQVADLEANTPPVATISSSVLAVDKALFDGDHSDMGCVEVLQPGEYPQTNFIKLDNMMVCEHCGTTLSFMGGIKKGDCPGCGEIVELPDAPQPEENLDDNQLRILAIASARGKVYPNSRKNITQPNLPAIKALEGIGYLRKTHSHYKLTASGKDVCTLLLNAIKTKPKTKREPSVNAQILEAIYQAMGWPTEGMSYGGQNGRKAKSLIKWGATPEDMPNYVIWLQGHYRRQNYNNGVLVIGSIGKEENWRKWQSNVIEGQRQEQESESGPLDPNEGIVRGANQ